jgi:hypothetical protein
LPAAASDLPLRPLLGVSALALAALPQGMLLPLLVRVREERSGAAGRVALFWLANLAGATAGAFLFAESAARPGRRVPAVGAAGAAALVSALARGGARAPSPAAAPERPSPAAPRARRRSGRGGAACSSAPRPAWVVGLEGINLRLGVLWLGGMQDALAGCSRRA